MLSLFVAAAFGTAAAAAPPNPLALAEKGQLQCYRSDVQKKTCQSIAAYRRTGPGTYDNQALVAQATAPLADKEICTGYEPSGADFTTKVTVDGKEQPGLKETVKWISPSEGYTVTP